MTYFVQSAVQNPKIIDVSSLKTKKNMKATQLKNWNLWILYVFAQNIYITDYSIIRIVQLSWFCAIVKFMLLLLINNA